MVAPHWWIISFKIVNGLTKMPMQPSTNEDHNKLPHVIITSNDCQNSSQKEPCLTLTLMDERLDTKP